MLAWLQMPRAELSVVLTGDDQIQKLNHRYRGNNRPTDVLAFAQREGALGERAGRLLGDVVVSVPTAQRQAEQRGRGVVAELTELLAHGLLHLLGYDHDTPAKDRRMRQETKRLCLAAQGGRASDASIRRPRERPSRPGRKARKKRLSSMVRRARRTATQDAERQAMRARRARR
jgi:probable rRNA maturation factor